jgi:hypothetical protein
MRARGLIATGGTTLAVLVAGLVFAGAPALAAESYVFSGGVGGFSQPVGVAVNQTTGHVYVVNYGAGVVENFDASGTLDATTPRLTGAAFTSAVGVAVDNSVQASKGDVYVTDLGGGVVYQFDPTGAATGVQIAEGSIPAADAGNGAFEPVGVAVSSSGDLFVTDLQNDVVDEFSSTGVFVAQIGSPAQLVEPRLLAIDATNHLYVATELGVVEYDSSGACVNSCTPFDPAAHTGVAVDGAGAVFATGEGPQVSEYDASGTLVEAFGEASTVPAFGGLGSAFGVAVNDSTHVAYVADKSANVLDLFHLALLPTVSTAAATVTPEEATLHGTVNPEGIEVSDCEFEYGTSTAFGQSAPCVPAPSTIPVDSNSHTVSAQLKGIAGEYHYRMVARNANGESHGEDQTFTVVNKPTVDGESTAAITETAATLEAQVNPNGLQTTYAFEYSTTEAAGQLAGSITTVKGENLLTAGFGDQQASVTLNGLAAGQTYYYRALAENQVSEEKHTPATGAVEHFTTQDTPQVGNGTAENLTRTTATISGTIDPTGLETTYHIAYIDQAGYEQALAGSTDENANPYAQGRTTTPANAGSSYAVVPVGPIVVTELLPDTTYHYALVATNALGSVTGADASFTTAQRTPPIVTTGAASDIGQNTATLSGTVNTNGLQTEYGFEIGTEPGNYGPATGLGSLGGATTETVTLTVGGLQPGTNYYYRVTATNGDGTSQGATEAFTTPGLPASLTIPGAPSLIAPPAIAFPEVEAGSTTTTKRLTNAQKLTKALKACKKDGSKAKRARCEKQAQRKYGAARKRTRA